jgi:pimeloyl-ACP methyl ester carboxylesterase
MTINNGPLSVSTVARTVCGGGKLLKTGVLLLGATAGALAAANALIAWNTPPLGGRLSGGFDRYPARHGDMAYFVSGSGAPLLLLHALRPGNSSAEWENNYEALAEKYTVYAPDFLGWGLSDKPRHILRAADYAEQIVHFAEDVGGVKENMPCVVVASGEACTFALMAAQKSPQIFSRFVLVCPTSRDEYLEAGLSEEPKDARLHPLFKLLTLPLLGQTVLNVLTSHARLEADARQELFFDESCLGSSYAARLHIAAHQPGSATALAARAAGVLGGPWRMAWEKLAQPALLVWGRNAMPGGFETAPEWLALKPDADLEVFDDALLLPHVEHADDFNARVLQWLKR